MMIGNVDVTPDDGKGWFVGGQQVPLRTGNMLVVGPGEDHTFLSSSEGYLHFVVQAPVVRGDKIDVPGQGDALPREG